jgi:hypothetical protein
MPRILFINGFRFFFFSNEQNEPPHIHIAKGEGYAKYWIEPDVALAENIRFNNHDLSEIRKIILENLEELKEAWHGFFG